MLSPREGDSESNDPLTDSMNCSGAQELYPLGTLARTLQRSKDGSAACGSSTLEEPRKARRMFPRKRAAIAQGLGART
jgi:hypothetical protein